MPSRDVTALLAATREGDQEAAEQLFPMIYDELHRLATNYMRRERPDHTLQPTALVHEAYLKLVHPKADGDYQDQRHFLATAAIAMRHILVNHAKAKAADKRGGGRPTLAFDDAAALFHDRAIDLLALDEALDRLASLDADQARLVEMRFFAGMSVEQCAEAIGMSERTVHYEWAHARAWLRAQLEA